MECIILVRMNENCVVALSDDNDNIWTAKNYDEAVNMAENHMLCQARPYQIVELDEL